MKKKVLFSAYSLDVGGIETALVSLLNNIDYSKYTVTLILEKKQGLFLSELPKHIEIIEYSPNDNKNIILRKICNTIKRIKFYAKYHNKFDFAASFATYSKVGSFVSRTASKNSALWVHTDYFELYNNDIDKMKEFFNEIQYDKFSKIIFVSNASMQNFLKVFPEKTHTSMLCYNIVDYKKILKLSEEEIEEEKIDVTTFLVIGRHSEEEKKLTRVIDIADKLKKEKYNFRVLFIGEGKDTERYKNLVKEKELESQIIFLGAIKNPFPYFKISDAILLTSDYEGFPVVFQEAMILGLPIIATNVSDAKELIDKKYGLVAEKSVEDIYLKVKQYMDQGFNIQQKFNIQEQNGDTINKIEMLFDNK